MAWEPLRPAITAADSFDTIIGIRLANTTANMILVEVYVNDAQQREYW